MLRLLMLLVALAAICLACTQAPAPASGPPPTPSADVALVNGTPIPRAVYQRRLDVQRALLEGLDLTSEQGRAIEAQMAKDTLNQLIDFEILRQAGAARGITVTPEEVEQRLTSPVGGEAWDVMRASLNERSADPEYFRSLVEQQILSEKLMMQVVTDVPAAAEQVRIRRIAVETEDEARAALADLAAGQDFAQVAQARSTDPESRPRGGDVGFYPRGIVAPEVEEIAFSLPVGGVSQPFETPLGYEILQVIERSPDRPVSPEYQQLIRERKFSDWLRQQRERATIEYLDAKG